MSLAPKKPELWDLNKGRLEISINGYLEFGFNFGPLKFPEGITEIPTGTISMGRARVSKDKMKRITEIYIPESVEYIFYNFSSNPILGSDIYEISLDCPNLEKINIPRNIQYIDKRAFDHTKVFEHVIFKQEAKRNFFDPNGWTTPIEYSISVRNRLLKVPGYVIPIDKIKSIEFKIANQTIFTYNNDIKIDYFPEKIKTGFFTARGGKLRIQLTNYYYDYIEISDEEVVMRDVCRFLAKTLDESPKTEDEVVTVGDFIDKLLSGSRKKVANEAQFYCSNCGKSIDVNANFCKFCGSPNNRD